MSTAQDFLDSTVSDSGIFELDGDELHSGSTELSSKKVFREPGYEGSIDYRVRQLSYSSLLTLHSCPRKFQLNRLRSTHRAEESIKSTVTFAYGHIVGEAIQLALAGKSEQDIIWTMYLGWHTDLANIDEKAHKSFWFAIFALQKFLALRESGFLQDYELVYYEGKPACELSFAIVFPDGFRLRGFVDAVLRHKESGEILVLECKTTGLTTLNPATYKNSSQAIGYSVVLDHLFPDLSSYKVLYLVYQTKQKEYTPIPFVKTFLQRALWIRELLLDIDVIKLYESAEVYPMRGESCLNFGRECEYFQVCTLSTEFLTKPCTPEEEDVTNYQIVLSLEDLLDSQLRKVEVDNDIS
jgi:hypothetical protein